MLPIAQSQSLGFPTVARVFTPHPIQDRTDDEMIAYADAAFDEIVAAITAGLDHESWSGKRMVRPVRYARGRQRRSASIKRSRATCVAPHHCRPADRGRRGPATSAFISRPRAWRSLPSNRACVC